MEGKASERGGKTTIWEGECDMGNLIMRYEILKTHTLAHTDDFDYSKRVFEVLDT